MVTARAENVYHRCHGLVFKALVICPWPPFLLNSYGQPSLTTFQAHQVFSEHILSFSNHIPFNFNFFCLYNGASFLFADILTNLHNAEKWPVPYLNISWLLWSKWSCFVHCTLTEHSVVTPTCCFVFCWLFMCSRPPEWHNSTRRGDM